VGWFTAHIREGIAVTGHQLELLQPALARPGRLDDAAVARIIRVHQEQAGDLVHHPRHRGAAWHGDGRPRSFPAKSMAASARGDDRA
jgi:hypothetical protein